MLVWLSGVLILVVGLLVVPVHLQLSVGTRRGPRPWLRVTWLFGVLRKSFGAGEKKDEEEREEPAPREAAAEPPRSRAAGSAKALRVARILVGTRGLAGRVMRLPRQLLRCARVRRLRIALRLGLDDPAATGELCGVLHPAFAWASELPRLECRFHPEFAEPALECDVEGEVRIVPARVALVLGGFLLSAPVLRGVKAWVWAARA